MFFSSQLITAEPGAIRSAVPVTVIAGALGIGIIGGVAFAFPRTGIAAGGASIILGQMTVAIVVDTFGWAGAEPIPLNLSRIAGLVILAVAIRLLLPASG